MFQAASSTFSEPVTPTNFREKALHKGLRINRTLFTTCGALNVKISSAG